MARLEGKVIREMLTRKTPVNLDELPEVVLKTYGYIPFTALTHLGEMEKRIESDPRYAGKQRKLLRAPVTDWVKFEPAGDESHAEGLERVMDDATDFLYDFLLKNYFSKPAIVYVTLSGAPTSADLKIKLPELSSQLAHEVAVLSIYWVAGLRQNIVAWHSIQEGQNQANVKSTADVRLDFLVHRPMIRTADNQFSIPPSVPSYSLLTTTCSPLDFIESVMYIALQKELERYTVENLNGSVKRSGQPTEQLISNLVANYAMLEKIAARALSMLAAEAYAKERNMQLNPDEIGAFHEKYRKDPTLQKVRELADYLTQTKGNLQSRMVHGFRLYVNKPAVLQELLRRPRA